MDLCLLLHLEEIIKKDTIIPLKRGKWDANEGGIRVPFIVTGPKIKASSQSQTPISFSDLLPTIIDLAGGGEIEKQKIRWWKF